MPETGTSILLKVFKMHLAQQLVIYAWCVYGSASPLCTEHAHYTREVVFVLVVAWDNVQHNFSFH